MGQKYAYCANHQQNIHSEMHEVKKINNDNDTIGNLRLNLVLYKKVITKITKYSKQQYRRPRTINPHTIVE